MEVADAVTGGISGNPYFNAGFGLTLLAGGLAFAKRAAMVGMQQIRRASTVTLEVTSKDKSYPWVLSWINAQSKGTLMRQHVSVDTTVTQQANGSSTTRFKFSPAPGNHMFYYNGRWIHVQRNREKQFVDLTSGAPWETLRLTTVGRDSEFFESFLNHARDSAASAQEGCTVIYTSWGTDWQPFGQPRKKRPLPSVVLDDGVAESIVNDVKTFIGSLQWYTDRGIPYRRGYLLHGTPGSGKSSFIFALAGHIGYNICTMNLNDRGLTDDRLAHAMVNVPPPSIVLLEDIDAAFHRSREADEKFGTKVTFSGLLNALDGVMAGEERLVFMTTNHIERLDPALIRPGRVDVMHRLGPATPTQIRRLYQMFYPKVSRDDVERFVAAVQNHGISMAALQGYFMLFRDSPDQALAHVGDFLAQHSDRASMYHAPGEDEHSAVPLMR